MHFYACPYCIPCKKSNLEKMKDSSDYEECIERADGDEVLLENCVDLDEYACPKCKESFIGTKDFLREQKRKIKDG